MGNFRSMSESVFRVTIRGQFKDLSDESRQYLTRSQPEHDIFVSAYTPEGTFTYDERILFFNLRYEVRCKGDDPKKQAELHALNEAESFMRTMKFGHVFRSTTVTDVSEMWTSE